MKILVFLHGTVIMHKSGLGVSREERVKQVIRNESSVLDYASYVPVGKAVSKLRRWKEQDAEILYLSSHEKAGDVNKDRLVLKRYGFPEGQALFRSHGEGYGDIAKGIMPDVIVEDDCESIGGKGEMVFPNIKPKFHDRIKSIVVREFEGIDHLPDSVQELLELQ